MGQLAATANSLRDVKQAYRSFLVLWALDRLTADARAMSHVAADVRRQAEQALADPFNHNWALLYRGSVLDD